MSSSNHAHVEIQAGNSWEKFIINYIAPPPGIGLLQRSD